MKTVRMLFACLAVAIASVSVYANTLFVNTFYRSNTQYSGVPTSAPAECAVTIATQACLASSGTICTIPVDVDHNYVVSKVLTGQTIDDCSIAKKAN